MDEPNQPRGFSIIELLAVMAIIAITAAISIPLGIDYVRNYEVMSAAQSVATQMQAARAQAVRRNARRGLILNFDYPGPGQSQFTTLDEDPVNGGYDGCVYPAAPGVFTPDVRDYGTAPPSEDCSTQSKDDLPSPHGPIITLPTDMEFVGGQTYSSLLFRVDGSVEAVNATNVTGKPIWESGLDWMMQIRHPRYDLTRTITISRNGRVLVTSP